MKYLETHKRLFLEAKLGIEKILIVAMMLFLGIVGLSIIGVYIVAFFTGVMTVGGFITMVIVFTAFKKFLKIK
jgi:hypothetical protein